MIFTSPVERSVPNRLAAEHDALTQQVDLHRATLLRKLEGLCPGDRRPSVAL